MTNIVGGQGVLMFEARTEGDQFYTILPYTLGKVKVLLEPTLILPSKEILLSYN
ncbi:hypothetical protein ACIQLG_04790 [Terribacillus saccharophilus]|uniref:hypothetical protein n=1 Tax=Terribacillus saccharophilus TaxID=361277 RepID=UPI00382234A8